MNLLQISWLYNLNPFGVENRVYNISKHLMKSGYNVDILCANTVFKKRWFHKGEIPTINIPLPIYPYRFGLKYTWESFFLKIASFYIRHLSKDYDIYQGEGINSLPFIINNKKHVITTIHGIDHRWGKLLDVVLDKSDVIIAVTKLVKKKLVAYGVPEEKIDVIYNGVNVEEIGRAKKELSAEKFNLDENWRYLLCVHSFLKYKNTENIILAFNRFIKNNNNYKLLLVGTGPLESHLKNRVNALGLNDAVIFLGKQEPEIVASLYKNADMFIHAAENETFGIVYLEAMAAEVPILGVNQGGIAEVLRNDETAYLIQEPTISNIYRGMKFLAENKDYCRRIKNNAKEKVTEFDWETIAKRLKKIHHEALQID
jgi:glycosyltransferase involved in cell wall biosynthesis